MSEPNHTDETDPVIAAALAHAGESEDDEDGTT